MIISFGDGYQYVDSYVKAHRLDIKLRRISGVHHEYKGSKLAPLRTYIRLALFMVFQLYYTCMEVEGFLDEFKPHLAIVDFEPCLSCLSTASAIPCLSIDHQHFIRFCDLLILPLLLSIRAVIGRWVCRIYVPNAEAYIVSTFFNPILRKHVRDRFFWLVLSLEKALKN